MAHPVSSGQHFRPGHFAGQIGDERQGGRLIGNAFSHLAERVQHRLHERRVKGMRDGQFAALDPLGGELVGNGQHRFPFSGDDHTGWPIHRGDRYVILVRQEGGLHRCLVSHERHHCANLR